MNSISKLESTQVTRPSSYAKRTSPSATGGCMSLSDDPRRNDEYGWIDKAAGRLLAAARDLIQRNEASRVSDEAVAQLMTAAIRLYVAKSDGEERTFRPIAGRKDEELTATELHSAVSELLRALRLGPMDLALWYRRRPDEDVYRDT